MPIPCEQKEVILEINRELKDLAMKIAAQEAVGTFSHEQITEIFSSLKQVKTYVDQNTIAANHRDAKLDEIISKMSETKEALEDVDKAATEYRLRIERKVEKIQVTVDNGLNARVDKLSKTTEENTKALSSIQICLEERKNRGLAKQEALDGKTGWSRFWALVSFSFDDFIRKYSAPIAILVTVGLFYFFLWFVTKAEVFGEQPIKGIFRWLFGG
jgi:hypothetical protein